MYRHICTLSIANVLYRAHDGFAQQGYISLNNLTRPFWSDLLGDQFRNGDEDWISGTGGMFKAALQSLLDTGDRFMMVSMDYAPEGRMAEQLDRYVADLFFRR
jgi:hypothetical protein